MAAALLKAAAPGAEVRSAGLTARDGEPVSPEAVKALRGRGLDLAGHRSTALRANMVEWADLILTMTRAHREALLRRYPQAEGKVAQLLAFPRWGTGDCPEDLDVDDPIGGSQSRYDRCAEELERAVSTLLEVR